MSSKPHNPYTMRRHLLADPSHRPKIADVRKLVELVDWQDALIAEVTRQRDCLERENDELRDMAETEAKRL